MMNTLQSVSDSAELRANQTDIKNSGKSFHRKLELIYMAILNVHGYSFDYMTPAKTNGKMNDEMKVLPLYRIQSMTRPSTSTEGKTFFYKFENTDSSDLIKLINSKPECSRQRTATFCAQVIANNVMIDELKKIYKCELKNGKQTRNNEFGKMTRRILIKNITINNKNYLIKDLIAKLWYYVEYGIKTLTKEFKHNKLFTIPAFYFKTLCMYDGVTVNVIDVLEKQVNSMTLTDFYNENAKRALQESTMPVTISTKSHDVWSAVDVKESIDGTLVALEKNVVVEHDQYCNPYVTDSNGSVVYLKHSN